MVIIMVDYNCWQFSVRDECDNRMTVTDVKMVDCMGGRTKVKLQVMNNNDDFSLKELRWLRTAMIDMVYGGGTPETMRDYLNVLDKIENIIKRKCDK